jgi:hypothetical protein
LPDEEDPAHVDARRADALVAVCSATIADDPDPDRATVVVHADVDARRANGVSEDGVVIPPETVQRLLCTSRTQAVIEDRNGRPVRLGETSRLAPAWMLRQVRYRDGGCTFPACGARRFTEAHHIAHWRDRGKTTLENLALVCSFHHRLVHEHGWRMKRLADGDVGWFRPSGARMRAGPRAPTPIAA